MTDSQGTPYDPVKDAAAQEPLSPNEVKLVTRLFGDPFSFPLEFKAWLRGWLEEQFPRIGSLAVSAETGAAGAFVPPAGAMMDYGGDVAPGGYVMCDGAQYDKTALPYQRLFAAIGYKFSHGVTTGNLFQVPDRQEAVSIMRGPSAGMSVVGQTGGEKTHTLGTSEIEHRHGSAGVQVVIASTDGSFKAAADTIAGSGGAASASPHNNMQPFLVVNVIISLGS